MATHSSILAWRIPRTEDPGRLQSIGLHRVGHGWSNFSQHSTALRSIGPSSSLIIQLLSLVWLFATPRLQHAGLPRPSLSPRVCSNSCPLSGRCHPTISSSVIPFSSCPQSFQHQGLFHWVSSSHRVAKVLELYTHCDFLSLPLCVLQPYQSPGCFFSSRGRYSLSLRPLKHSKQKNKLREAKLPKAILLRTNGARI